MLVALLLFLSHLLLFSFPMSSGDLHDAQLERSASSSVESKGLTDTKVFVGSALPTDPDGVMQIPIDPEEERRLRRKLDLM
jgi:hypothetical protein